MLSYVVFQRRKQLARTTFLPKSLPRILPKVITNSNLFIYYIKGATIRRQPIFRMVIRDQYWLMRAHLWQYLYICKYLLLSSLKCKSPVIGCRRASSLIGRQRGRYAIYVKAFRHWMPREMQPENQGKNLSNLVLGYLMRTFVGVIWFWEALKSSSTKVREICGALHRNFLEQKKNDQNELRYISKNL